MPHGAVAELYLAGKYVSGLGGAFTPVHSPAIGEHLADLPMPTDAEVNAAVAAARAALTEYRHWSVHERAELCHRIADLVEGRADELARLTTHEQGKPINEARDDVRHRGAVPRLRRGRQTAVRRDHPEHRPQQADVHLPRPGRGLGRHHAVELPAHDHGRVPRPRARHRQRDRLQAARAPGQVCCASERVIVDAAVHDEFLAACVQAASAVRLGNPFGEMTTLGPLNNEPTASKMDRHIADAVAQGAQVVLGGGRAQGYPTPLYYEYTLLDAVTPQMLVAREESSGPILPILVGDGDEEILRLANASELGLQAAVFTNSLRRAFRYGEGLRAGRSSSTSPPNTSRVPSPSAGPGAPVPAGAASAAWRNCAR